MTYFKETVDIEKECGVCGSDLIDYFDETYNGNRARCPNCNNNFPLE